MPGAFLRCHGYYQKEIEAKERIIVGVNAYQTEGEEAPETLYIDSIVEDEQIQRLNTLKKNRNNEKVDLLLSELKAVAEGTDNLMPIIIKLVKAKVSVGEIIDALKSIWGEYKEDPVY